MKRPKFRRPKPGEVWHVKRGIGRVVLTGQLHEIDGDTFVIQWLNDGAVRPRTGVANPLRFDRNDFEFIKRVRKADEGKSAGACAPRLVDTDAGRHEGRALAATAGSAARG